jgi:hypothetical protein
MYRSNNRTNQGRPYDPTKKPRFVHREFSIIHVDNEKEKLEVKCDKDGRLTIIQTDKLENVDDQVTISASLIFTLATMLDSTRRVYMEDRTPKKDAV